jgi:preprotein translocase subunit SecA
LHAHALLHRDVDYVVKDGAVKPVDEFKGRIAQDRRWPAGLHAAIEAKEGLAPKVQGRILGSVTLQNLMALYYICKRSLQIKSIKVTFNQYCALRAIMLR